MGIAASAREQGEQELAGASDKSRHRACEQKAILVSLNNLMTFPWIRERVEQGSLTLHGWDFDIEGGAWPKFPRLPFHITRATPAKSKVKYRSVRSTHHEHWCVERTLHDYCCFEMESRGRWAGVRP